MKRLNHFLILISITAHVFTACLARSDEHPSDAQVIEAAVASLSESGAPRKKRFRGYGRYKKSFDEACDYIEKDGRLGSFFALIEANNTKDLECIACKPLFSVLESACKPKIVSEKPRKKTEKEEPENDSASEEGKEREADSKAVVHKKQREPHIKVIDLFSAVFSEIGAEEDLEEHYKAVEKFVTVLRKKEGKSKAEFEYFSALSAYVQSPFEKYARKAAKDSSRQGVGGAAKKGSKEELDSMFDF